MNGAVSGEKRGTVYKHTNTLAPHSNVHNCHLTIHCAAYLAGKAGRVAQLTAVPASSAASSSTVNKTNGKAVTCDWGVWGGEGCSVFWGGGGAGAKEGRDGSGRCWPCTHQCRCPQAACVHLFVIGMSTVSTWPPPPPAPLAPCNSNTSLCVPSRAVVALRSFKPPSRLVDASSAALKLAASGAPGSATPSTSRAQRPSAYIARQIAEARRGPKPRASHHASSSAYVKFFSINRPDAS